MASINMLFIATLLSLASAVAAQEHPVVIDPQADSVAWGACPPIFDSGCRIAVLHGDPSRPNSDLLLRIPAGTTLPPHTHSSAERMVLISGELMVRYQGHPQLTLQPGHYAFGPAGLPHLATCLGSAPCDLFIAFEGPVDAFAHTDSLD